MPSEPKKCQFHYCDLHDISSSVRLLRLRRLFYSLNRTVTERESLTGFFKTKLFSLIKMQATSNLRKPIVHQNEVLNLQQGELVEIRSEQEILATLDEKGKLRGLSFMPEMKKYCGKRFRVYKRLEKITLETTGEMRKIKDTVLLEGALCDGSAHFGCDRSCFCFWREAWLKRINDKEKEN